MGRLRAAMAGRFRDRDEDVKIHTPRNLETLELSFRGERVAKVNSCVLIFHFYSRIVRQSALWPINHLRKETLSLAFWFQKTTRTRCLIPETSVTLLGSRHAQ